MKIKYFYAIIFLLFFTVLFFLGCKNKSSQSIIDIINLDKNENITIAVDPMLKDDIENRLKEISKENLVDLEIKTESDKNDAIITTDKKNIPENWKIEEIYQSGFTLKPDSFNDKFASKFADGLVVYIGSEKKEIDPIKKVLVESFKNNPPETKKIIFLGDIMLSRTVEDKARKAGDWNWPFLKIKDSIVPTDLTVANLESPFSDPPKPFAHTTVFGADKNMVQGLKYGVIDIVCLANNHFGDSGKKGMELTLQTLKDNNILYFGAGENSNASHKATIKEIKGVKFAFLGYVTPSVTPSTYASGAEKPGLNLMDLESLKSDLTEAKKQANYVVVSMHAGTEYTPNPGSEQIEFAHTAIDNGADIVYGHHPHVVQAIEIYNDKPIFYSLGNFVFDQEWSEETKEGIIVKMDFIYDKIVSVELTPILIENFGQPRTAPSSVAQNILERIYKASQ